MACFQTRWQNLNGIYSRQNNTEIILKQLLMFGNDMLTQNRFWNQVIFAFC